MREYKNSDMDDIQISLRHGKVLSHLQPKLIYVKSRKTSIDMAQFVRDASRNRPMTTQGSTDKNMNKATFRSTNSNRASIESLLGIKRH